MENMERFTPLYVIAYVITNSMENLRFDKEDYFHVLVFYTGYFIKEIENISPVFPYVIETLVEVWENPKLRGNTRAIQARVPNSISLSPNKLPLAFL